MMSVPGRRMSAVVQSWLSGDVRRYTEKMVPTETLQSMFEEPSSGSNATQNGPRLASSLITMGSSCSSLTRRPQTPERERHSTQMSSAMRSNFFTSSPVEFSVPASPYSPAGPARSIALVTTLQACWIAFASMASSLSPFVEVMMYWVKVIEFTRLFRYGSNSVGVRTLFFSLLRPPLAALPSAPFAACSGGLSALDFSRSAPTHSS
mmetsp:Transcript_101981/g.311928  ORF Transcript_101981/g.311928 Transcript_101981/m.311928 type:complete len:207 (+) Transcript_101981:590-1210(+)